MGGKLENRYMMQMVQRRRMSLPKARLYTISVSAQSADQVARIRFCGESQATIVIECIFIVISVSACCDSMCVSVFYQLQLGKSR